MSIWWKSIERHKSRVERALENATRIAVYDVETTGLLKDDPKIIQFSAILYDFDNKTGQMVEIDRMNSYINPKEPLDPKVVEITEITDDMLMHAETEEIVGPRIIAFLSQADVLVGYNQESFDNYVLRNMSKRLNLPDVSLKPNVDVLKMCRNIVPFENASDALREWNKEREANGEEPKKGGRYRLQTIHPYLFPLGDKHYHDSMADVEATADCFSLFLDKYRKSPQTPNGTIQRVVKNITPWVNPNQYDMKRLKIFFEDGNKDAVFWDITKQRWSCKADKASQEYFKNTDLQYVEDQVLNNFKYRCCQDDKLSGVFPETMDTLGWSIFIGYNEYKKAKEEEKKAAVESKNNSAESQSEVEEELDIEID